MDGTAEDEAADACPGAPARKAGSAGERMACTTCATTTCAMRSVLSYVTVLLWMKANMPLGRADSNRWRKIPRDWTSSREGEGTGANAWAWLPRREEGPRDGGPGTSMPAPEKEPPEGPSASEGGCAAGWPTMAQEGDP